MNLLTVVSSWFSIVKRHKLVSGVGATIVVVAVIALVLSTDYGSRQTQAAASTKAGENISRTAANGTKAANGTVLSATTTNDHSIPASDKLAASPTAASNPSAGNITRPTGGQAQPVPANTPKPKPAPSPIPNCPECGGDPDKIPSHTGALIINGGPVTIASNSFSYSGLTARSDSGEAIAIVYVQYGPDVPMIMTSFSPDAYSIPFDTQRTFGFNANMNVAPGTYNLKLIASGANKGMYTSYATVVVTTP